MCIRDSVCGVGTCTDHGMVTCAVEGHPTCERHAGSCESCGRMHCTIHAGRCGTKDHEVCSACLVHCGRGGLATCEKHRIRTQPDGPLGQRWLCVACAVRCEADPT